VRWRQCARPRTASSLNAEGPAYYSVLQQPAGRRPGEEAPHLARRPVLEVPSAVPKIWIYRLRRRAGSRVKFVKRVTVADADA